MTQKHTTAPWIFNSPHNGSQGDAIFTADMKTIIAHCNANNLTTEQNKINGRLVAAAPELLAELKKLEQSVMDCIESFPESVKILLESQCEAIKAINKAEGK